MAVQSRSPKARLPRNSDTSSSSAATNNLKHPHKQARSSKTAPLENGSNIIDDTDGPPAKRRKLSIRSKQTTLDGFTTRASQSATPKPPTKVTVSQPHGRLVEKVNGIQRLLDADEDDLSLPASGTTTPNPKRVPKTTSKLEDTTKQQDKRTLRSQDDGPRLKSELAIYFPNYEDIIFDAPKDPEFITVDSALYITDDSVRPKHEQSTSPKSNQKARASPTHTRKTSTNGITSPTSPQRTSSNQFNGSPTLNLEMIARSLPTHPEDPLTNEHFLKSHRRAERKEKQLRNIEKERAMHEKVQLDRILEGLLGHDWLKVLGITGITDSEAKKFEPKRDYFIAEVKALVDKFKLWKEQERRQKVDKGTPIPVREEEEEEEEEQEIEDSDAPSSEKSSLGPPSSDLNASAARQLQQETAIALKSLPKSGGLKQPLPPPVPPPPEAPITSFYAKRHLRDAALGKARHGRNVTAFGHPVPELDVQEFELPGDIGSEEAVRANAREKRRRRREDVANSST